MSDTARNNLGIASFGVQSYKGSPNTTKIVNLEAMNTSSTVNIVASNGNNKYVFNNGTTYDSNKKFSLTNGTYTFKSIPQGHPMAILSGNSNISYSGDNDKKFNDGTYDYFYGDIDVTVNGDFNEVSVNCYYHGYMGGENLLVYNNS